MNSTNNTLLTNLKKATIEMFLLKLLRENDMYGYQLSQELKRRSEGKYTILEGSMYPILYRLTEQKCISFYEVKSGKRQVRIFYHLEDKGRDHLQCLMDTFEDYITVLSHLLNFSEGDTDETS